jgi:hypothetical protein
MGSADNFLAKDREVMDEDDLNLDQLRAQIIRLWTQII